MTTDIIVQITVNAGTTDSTHIVVQSQDYYDGNVPDEITRLANIATARAKRALR